MTARIVVMLYFILCEATWSKILEQNRFRVLGSWRKHGAVRVIMGDPERVSFREKANQ